MAKRFTAWAVVLLIAAVSLSGCQATVGGMSLMVRPAVRILPRVMETGDGEQVFIEGYEPRGDSYFIVIRMRPKADQKKGAAMLPSLPSGVRQKLKNFQN